MSEARTPEEEPSKRTSPTLPTQAFGSRTIRPDPEYDAKGDGSDEDQGI